MAKARIYRPDKTAMQSGKGKASEWRLEYAPEKPFFVNNLTGWTGMTDMKQEIHLSFPTCEEAVAYAQRQHIPYEVTLPRPRAYVRKAYADNFKFSKVNG